MRTAIILLVATADVTAARAVTGALALATALLVFWRLTPRRLRRMSTLDLATRASAQLMAESLGERRPGYVARVVAAYARRAAEANKARLGLQTFLLLSAGAGLLTGLVCTAVLGTPIFGLIGSLYGLTLPWAWLTWRAAALRQAMDRAVLDFLRLLALSTAGTASPVGAFMEAAANFKNDVLGRYVVEARDAVDPRVGVGGRQFAEILGRLNRDIGHPWFELAAEVLTRAYENGESPRVPLADVRDFAAASYAAQLDAYADVAFVRRQAMIMYGLPLILTVGERAVSPEVVDTYYQTPGGMVTAVVVTLGCALCYRRIVNRERRLVDEARQGR